MRDTIAFLATLSCLVLSIRPILAQEITFLAKKEHTKKNHDIIYDEEDIKLVNNRSNVALQETNDKNTENSTSQNDGYINFYHSILNSSFFYGTWNSDENSNLFNFKNQEGFVYSNFRTHKSFDIQLSIFDGPYVDQGSIAMAFDYTANAPIVNADNGTVYLERLWVEYRKSGSNRAFSEQNYCLTNATIYFIDLRTSTALAPADAIPPPERVGIQFEIDNESCPFRLITSIMASKDKLVESQYIPYSLTTVLLVIAQGVLTHLFNDVLTERPIRARNVSAWSFMFLNAFDFYLTIFNTANFIDPLTIYAIISIPYLFLALNMQRIIWTVFDIQTLHLDPQTRDRTICEMYIWIYILLVVPSVISFLLFADFIFFFSFSFLVPQIIHNFKNGLKYKTKPWMIIGLTFPKLAFMAYLKLDPNNLFRYAPNMVSFFIFTALVVFQVIALIIQSEWPRFGFEVKSSYFFFKAHEANENVCAICLENFRPSLGNNMTDSLLDDDEKGGDMIRTPCRHEFHEDCLRRWVEAKLECPYCRQPLPQLDESSDDEF